MPEAQATVTAANTRGDGEGRRVGKAAVNRLVMFANAHGGKDNITVILIRIVAPDWKPPV